MKPLELSTILKRLVASSSIFSVDSRDKDLNAIRNYLDNIKDTETLRLEIKEICLQKAEIIAETQNFVITLMFMLEFMMANTVDLMFAIDKRNGNTCIDIIQEASKGYTTLVHSDVLENAVKDIPTTTISIGTNTSVILLTRLGYLPSPVYERKTVMVMEYTKYREYERRISDLEKKVDNLLTTLHTHIKES